MNIILADTSGLYSLLNRDDNYHGVATKFYDTLDVIDYANDALIAFENKEFGDSKSALCLATYGVLQALVVQQDATFHLAESLGIALQIQDYPPLQEVREIRNNAIGYPTKRNRKRGSPVFYNHISQSTMTQVGFEMLSFSSDGQFELKRKIDNIVKLSTRRRPQSIVYEIVDIF